MSQLEVVLQVPRYIEAGLASGQFERVGGVIVESGSKQVVAWLRDGTVLENAPQLLGNVSPLSAITNVAQSGITVMDGMQTRAVMRLLETQIHNLASFTVAGQLLNLSMTFVSMRVILNRVSQLSDLVVELGEIVRTEFERERDIKFRGALQRARDALESASSDNRVQSAHSAINELYQAREQFLIDFSRTMQPTYDYENLLLAQQYLIRAMHAESGQAYCYLETGEEELAKQRLAEGIECVENEVKNLIEHWLGKHPAIFMHKDVPKVDLERFLKIKVWLTSGAEFTLPTITTILDDLRVDFWNSDVTKTEYSNVFKRVTRQSESNHQNRISELSDRLTQAEILIENFNRLLGFDLELRALRLSHADWKSEVIALMMQDEAIKESPMVLIHDLEAEAAYASA